jgi:hypothetical protein
MFLDKLPRPFMDEESGGAGGTGDEPVIEGERESAAPSGDTGRTGHMIPKGRLDEEIRKRQALQTVIDSYAKFGKPEELAGKLKRFDELAQGKRFTEGETKEIREDLLRVFPELGRVINSEQERMSHFTDIVGPEATRKFLKEAGIEVTDDNLADMSEVLAGRIIRDKKLFRMFAAQDPNVYTEAWKSVKPRLFARRPGVPGADVQKLKEAPKPPIGKPKGEEPKAPAGPKDDRDALSDAGDAAWERLQELAQ